MINISQDISLMNIETYIKQLPESFQQIWACISFRFGAKWIYGGFCREMYNRSPVDLMDYLLNQNGDIDLVMPESRINNFHKLLKEQTLISSTKWVFQNAYTNNVKRLLIEIPEGRIQIDMSPVLGVCNIECNALAYRLNDKVFVRMPSVLNDRIAYDISSVVEQIENKHVKVISAYLLDFHPPRARQDIASPKVLKRLLHMICDRGFTIDPNDDFTHISVLSQLQNRDFIKYGLDDLVKLFMPLLIVDYSDLIFAQLDAFPLLNYLSHSLPEKIGELIEAVETKVEYIARIAKLLTYQPLLIPFANKHLKAHPMTFIKKINSYESAIWALDSFTDNQLSAMPRKGFSTMAQLFAVNRDWERFERLQLLLKTFDSHLCGCLGGRSELIVANNPNINYTYLLIVSHRKDENEKHHQETLKCFQKLKAPVHHRIFRKALQYHRVGIADACYDAEVRVNFKNLDIDCDIEQLWEMYSKYKRNIQPADVVNQIDNLDKIVKLINATTIFDKNKQKKLIQQMINTHPRKVYKLIDTELINYQQLKPYLQYVNNKHQIECDIAILQNPKIIDDVGNIIRGYL